MKYILWGAIPKACYMEESLFPNSLLDLYWHTHLIQSKISSKIDEYGNS